MNLKGEISWVGPVLGGTSQRTGNDWSKQDFVLKYNLNSQYPNEICLSVFNQDKYIGKLRVGLQVSVDFDCNVRDWTDKNNQLHKQNDLTVWREGIHSIQPQGQSAPQAQAPAQQAPQAAPQQQTAQPAQPANNGSSDDLPF